jgi:hypothetical protein
VVWRGKLLLAKLSPPSSELPSIVRTAELEQHILRLEHEGALIEHALRAGLQLERRPYASPWALLSISPGEPAEAMQAAE